MDDALTQMPGQPEASEILDKYLQAIGGAQKLAAVKSYIATGNSIGFGGFGGGAEVHIYAKSPDQRATHIEFKAETGRGEVWRTYNGHMGWIKSPLTVLPEYELTGGELDGARLDAQMGFPGQIKQVLTNLRVSLPITISDLPAPSSQTSQDAKATAGLGQDRLVNVVQGAGPNGMLATLYFDQKSNLLLRMVRYARSPIGRVPTQVDYTDYRDAGGVLMPYHLTFAWLDGRDAIQLNKVETNVPIDAAVFGKPPSNR